MRLAAVALLALAAPAAAGPAEIVAADLSPQAGERWRVSVTLRHADEGWDHYADAWAVHAPDGTRLGLRTLHHPHVNEQPFTRSLSGVAIPADAETVTIRARDSVHGWADATLTIPVPR